MNKILDVCYSENDNEYQKLDIYIPDCTDFDTIVWFHGGGIEWGNRNGKTELNLAKAYTDKGICFVSVQYRLYPDAHFPEYIEDAAQSVKYTVDNIRRFGGNGNVFVAGSSAGAYLTMMLCLDEHYLGDIGTDTSHVCGFISDSAQQFTHFNILKYEHSLDTRLERIDNTAPIYHLKPDLKIKPLVIIYYTRDIVCRPEENRLMYASIKSLMPESKVELIELEGGHTQGSNTLDPDGEYPIVKIAVKFIKQVNESNKS